MTLLFLISDVFRSSIPVESFVGFIPIRLLPYWLVGLILTLIYRNVGPLNLVFVHTFSHDHLSGHDLLLVPRGLPALVRSRSLVLYLLLFP